MTRTGATALRNRIGDLLARVRYRKERVIIEHRGKPVAALIPLEDLELLERLEEEWETRLLRAAKRSSEKLVPFEELIAQYERLHGERLAPPAEAKEDAEESE